MKNQYPDIVDKLANEALIMRDQFVLSGQGIKTTTENKTDLLEQVVYLMPYLGEEVYSLIIKDNTPLGERMDMAIQACWLVHQLHLGHSSITGTPTVHLDIKPDNLVRDNDSQVRLIDFGNAEQGLLDENGQQRKYHREKGTRRYIPPECTTQTLAQGDVYALKRTLWMNESIDGQKGYCLDSILPYGFFDGDKHQKLQRYITQVNDHPVTASFLAALLALATVDLDDELAEGIAKNEVKQRAIIVLHYAQKLTGLPKQQCLALLANGDTVCQIASLSPVIEAMPKELSAALVSHLTNPPRPTDKALLPEDHILAKLNSMLADGKKNPEHQFLFPRVMAWYYEFISPDLDNVAAFVNNQPLVSEAMSLLKAQRLHLSQFTSAQDIPGAAFEGHSTGDTHRLPLQQSR